MSGPLGAWLIPDQHSPLIVALDRHLSRVGLQKRRAADGRRQVLQRKGVDQDLLRRLQETGGYRGNKPAEGKRRGAHLHGAAAALQLRLEQQDPVHGVHRRTAP